MLLIQCLIVALIAYLAYYYFSSEPIRDMPDNLSFFDYIYLFYFHKKAENMNEMMKNKPRMGKHLLAHQGFVLLFVAIFFSLFAIVNNWLICSQHWEYIEFASQYGLIFFPVLIGVFFLITFYVYFWLEYRRYQNIYPLAKKTD